jgi:hypothetical protein
MKESTHNHVMCIVVLGQAPGHMLVSITTLDHCRVPIHSLKTRDRSFPTSSHLFSTSALIWLWTSPNMTSNHRNFSKMTACLQPTCSQTYTRMNRNLCFNRACISHNRSTAMLLPPSTFAIHNSQSSHWMIKKCRRKNHIFLSPNLAIKNNLLQVSATMFQILKCYQ